MVSGRYRICPESSKFGARSQAAQGGQKNGGVSPAVSFPFFAAGSAEQLKHALLRLVGKRQRGNRDRLAGRQRLAVGRFLVRIGDRQVGCAGLQHVDQVLRKILANLNDRQVGTQRRCFRLQRAARSAERGQHAVGRIVVQEIGAGHQRRQTKASCAEIRPVDGKGGLAGLVERQL